MTNYERFVRTINWVFPDRILTYDPIDNRELLEKFGGKGDLIERNARMASRIGLDVTRYVHDPDHHWMGAKIKNWMRFFGVDSSGWEVYETGGQRGFHNGRSKTSRDLKETCPTCP
jgi:hypothetical protein